MVGQVLYSTCSVSIGGACSHSLSPLAATDAAAHKLVPAVSENVGDWFVCKGMLVVLPIGKTTHLVTKLQHWGFRGSAWASSCEHICCRFRVCMLSARTSMSAAGCAVLLTFHVVLTALAAAAVTATAAAGARVTAAVAVAHPFALSLLVNYFPTLKGSCTSEPLAATSHSSLAGTKRTHVWRQGAWKKHPPTKHIH